VTIGETASPRKESASASPSLEVESNEDSLVVASLGACRFEPVGEAGGSAVPEGLGSELESDREFRAGAGPVVVLVGSFVLVETPASESAAASEGSAPEASVGVAERSVALTPSDVSVPPGVGAHVSVVPAAATEASVVPAAVSVVSVASGAVVHASAVHASAVHASVVSAAVTDVSFLPAEVCVASVASVASGAAVHASVVSAASTESSVVVTEVSVSGAVAQVSVMSDKAPESSVVVAEVSVVSGAVVHAPVVSAVPEVSVVESDDVAGASETDGEGLSARAVAANRDAQRRAASTATVQRTNPRPRRRSKRGDRMLGTAAELPSISASSQLVHSLFELRVLHLTSGAQGRDANRRAERDDDPSAWHLAQPQVKIEC
jgi:hypothetical protein